MKAPIKATFIINLAILIVSLFAVSSVSGVNSASAVGFGDLLPKERLLSSREMSLSNRNANAWVSGVMRDNILLNLAYLSGRVTSRSNLNWQKVSEPSVYEFNLNPDEVFAFHDNVLPEYSGRVAKTTNAHFNFQEGFKSDGYLPGDGVCHFASVIAWAATDARLITRIPTNHDFVAIPEIQREYGVAIYYSPGSISSNALKNLYVQNPYNFPITIRFQNAHDKLKVSIYKAS